MSPLVGDLRVVEYGGRAAAVCGLLFAQLGADVLSLRAGRGRAEDAWSPYEATALGANKRTVPQIRSEEDAAEAALRLATTADVVILDAPPAELERLGLAPERLCAAAAGLVVAAITPFGLTGPRRDYRGGDLVAFHASGIARLLVGHVEDAEAEPPVRAYGEQAAFVAGLTAACAAMHALYGRRRGAAGETIDVSVQEALALMAARELAMPGFGGQPAPRRGPVLGGSATIPVLPTRDGYVAVSPREAHQWQRWLKLLGDPEWGSDPRFASRGSRAANYAALYEGMAAWSRERWSREIFEAGQAEHVPCFPFGRPADMLAEPQLAHRGFFGRLVVAGQGEVLVPRPPFGLPPADYAEPSPAGEAEAGWGPEAIAGAQVAARLRPGGPAGARDDKSDEWQAGRPRDDKGEGVGEPSSTAPDKGGARGLPLAGVRVLDFSWVIAGPTCTRYLALMGAEVIKVEAPERPDTGRVSELHDVLGQSKLGLALDLKAPGALEAVRQLVAGTDVVVENFATGVMERLGLGFEDLRRVRPDIVLHSASGLGRRGPGGEWVAYGNLLSAYSGFAALNGFGRGEPRTGLAWADPLCGLFMAFAVVAALRERDRGGGGRHIDFSMLEALLWTMPDPLLRPQMGGSEALAAGNEHALHYPHGVYRCRGDDRWLAVAVTTDEEWRSLCRAVEALAPLAGLSGEARRARRETIEAALADWARDREAIEAMEALQAAGVPASASYTTNDMFEDRHLWERGFYRPVKGPAGRFLPSLPWRWGDGEGVEAREAPGLGEHNEYVLRGLAGLTEAEYEALRAAGALARAPRAS